MEKIGQENSNEHKLQNLQDKFKQFPEQSAEEQVKFLEETQVLFEENINWLLLIREFSNFENLFVEKKPVVKKIKFDVFLIQIYLQLRKQLETKENSDSEQLYDQQQQVIQKVEDFILYVFMHLILKTQHLELIYSYLGQWLYQNEKYVSGQNLIKINEFLKKLFQTQSTNKDLNYDQSQSQQNLQGVQNQLKNQKEIEQEQNEEQKQKKQQETISQILQKHYIQSYTYFEGNGAKIQYNQSELQKQKFGFSKSGIQICFWIYVNFPKNQEEKEQKEVTIFKILSINEKNQQSGIICYMRKNQVFYKIILNDTVQSDTQIAQVNFQQWNFIGIDHEPYKMMGSQTLRVQVNLEKRVNFSTKFPNISVNNKISDLVVGQNLSGKIGSLIIFKYSNFQKMEDINKQCQLGIISQKHIDQLGYFVNEKDFHNKIFFLLSPVRCNKREVQDVFSNFKGKFVGLSGFHVKNDQDFNIVSCGGLQGLLPLTYLIRFVQKEGSEGIVNQLVINFFEILGCVLDNNKSGQTQAVKMGFFKQLSNLLNEIYMFEKLNSDIWKCIVSFQKKIVYPILTEQFVSDFLWSLKAVHNLNNDILIKEQVFANFHSIYKQNVPHFNSIYGIKNIIKFIMLQLNINNKLCCRNHCQLLGLEKEFEKQQNQVQCDYSQLQYYQDLIVMILKGTIRKIQIESEELIDDILQLLLGANHKGSLCFLKFCMVSLVSFVNCLPVEFQKKYCAILVQNNALYSFLHILQNSPCLFIKSQAVQMINLFVKNFGSLGISEQDICLFIKESIWLVIQYNESSELKKSILEVKNKVQKKKKEQEQEQQQLQEQIKNEQQQLQEQIKNENQEQNESETVLVLPKKKGKKTIQLDSNLFPNFDQPEPKLDQKNSQNFGGNAPVPPTIRKKKPQGFGGFQLDMDENQMSGQSQDPGVKVFVPPKVPTGKKGGFSFGDHTIPRQSEQTSKNKISFQFPAVGKEKNGGFLEKLENDENQQNQQDFSGKQFKFEGGKNSRKNLGILGKKGFSINVVDEDEIQEHENEQESGKKNEFNEGNQGQQFQQEIQQDQEKEEQKQEEEEVQLKFQLPNKKFGKKKPIQFPAQMEIQVDDNDQVQENDQKDMDGQNNQQDQGQIQLENQDQYNMEEPLNQQQFQLPNNQKKEKKIPAFKKKFLKQQGLNIDTEQINSLYLYGGEQGAKIITKEDIEKDEQEIRELANLCVKYMNGEIELEQQDFYAQKMPDLSLRDKFMKQNEEKQQKMDQEYNKSLKQVQEIEEEEKQQQEEEIQLENQNQDCKQDLDINLSDKQDLDQEKDAEVQIDMNFKPKFGKNKGSFKSKKPMALQNNFIDNENENQNQDQDKNNQQMEIENDSINIKKNLEDIENNQDIQEQEKQVLDQEINQEEQEQENYKNINNDQNFNYYKDQWDIFYNSIMQWALDKNIMQSQQQQGLILDDSDKITSKYPFFIISTLFDIAPLSMKTKIIQDLNIITKENQVNAYIISNNTEQYFWLLNVILDNIIYLEFVDKASVSHQIILDQTLKINLNLMKQEMINNQVGDHIIDKIFKFIRIKQEELKNDKYNVLLESGLKILIQKIWGNFLVTLKPIMNKSRPTLSSIFWQNLLRYFLSTLFLLCTQLYFNKKQKSIQIQQLHISLMPYMEREDIQICQQFLEILKTLSADYLFNQKVSVKVELQKIENLLKFNQSSEFLKDFQIFQHKILNQISVLQIINLVLVTNIDQNINLFEQELQQKEKQIENLQEQSTEERGLQKYLEQIKKNLSSVETFLKFYLTICENSRDLTLYNQQKKEVFANITYIINYLYLKKIEFENKVEGISKELVDQNGNKNENNLELLYIKEKNEKIYQLFRKSIIEIFRFIFEMVYSVNQQYGNFDTFIQQQSNLENILNFESQNSSLNFNLYEFFQLLQSSYNQNCQGEFITMKVINDCQNQEYENLGDILFSDKFQEFFSDSIQMIPIISVSYSYDFIQKIFRVQQKGIDNPFYQFQIENQMNMKGKIESQKKIEDSIYVQVSKIYENLDIQKQKMQLVQEENLRIQLNLWHKLWKKQRIYNGLWRNDQFYDQKDEIFDVNQEYNKEKKNEIYSLKIGKYQNVQKQRQILKVKLKEPKIVQNYEKDFLEKFNMTLNRQFQSGQKFSLSGKKSSSNKGGEKGREGQENQSQSGFTFIPKNLKNLINNRVASFKDNQQKEEHISNYSSNKLENFLNSLEKQNLEFTANCQIVKTLTARNGTINIINKSLIFLYEGLEVKQNNLCMMNHKIQKHQQLIKEWGLQQIIEIQQRRYILQWTAVELFLVDGSSIFINFTDGQKKCKAFCDKLISMRKQIAFNLKYMDTLEPSKLVQKLELTKKWKDFNISNFEYLMKINQISGRTNHDISQYPVFPWIVADYLSDKHPMEKLAYSSYEEIQEIQKMEGKKFVRNLSNPIGVEGDPGRLQNYLDKFSMDGSQYDPNFKPFYYGSHYSSSAVIFQFLIRISPYTQGAILLQNGKFDLPDRMFFCVQESWNCCQREASDVRELIPEFYYLPEMYINQENYDFGEQQTGLRVHNVILPEYSQKNPYKFVCDMRQFMESNYTSNNINNWIDLIFGYKQQGKAAIDSINVFYYLTYEDNINMDNVDEDEKESIITQIQNFGQIPHQIFQKEHIQRNMIGLFKTAVDKEIKLKLFRHSANVVGNTLNRNEFLVYSNLPEKSLIKMLWREDKKIVTLSKNWQIKEFDWLHQAQVTSQDQVIPFTMILSKQGKVNLDLNKQFVEIDHGLSNLNAPICFLNKSKVIVLGGIWGGKLKVIFQEKSLIYDIQTNHKSVITCMRNDHKGNFLITGSRSGEVILWRIIPEYKLMQLQIYYDHKEEITDINYNEEMKCFATCSLDGSINIYNIYNGKHLRSLYHPQGLPIYNVILSCSPIGSICFYSRDDYTLYSYSINGQILEQKIFQNFNQIISPIIVKDSNFIDTIVYGNEIGQLSIRELPFLNLRQIYNVSQKIPVIQVMSSKNRRNLFCACADGEISILTQSQQYFGSEFQQNKEKQKNFQQNQQQQKQRQQNEDGNQKDKQQSQTEKDIDKKEFNSQTQQSTSQNSQNQVEHDI